MNIDLTDTTTRKVQDALSAARHRMGGPATGKVLSLVIVTDEAAQYDAVRASTEAAREHPCRVLVVIARSGREESRLDAEVRVGETGPGETVVLRLYGELVDHADSVIAPLLVPDTPVVTWWPGLAPRRPADEALGTLAQRRVTDARAGSDPSEGPRVPGPGQYAAQVAEPVPGVPAVPWHPARLRFPVRDEDALDAEPPELDGGRQPRRAGAHDENVSVHGTRVGQ